MDAGIFARQLTEALGNLTAGISIDPEDIDGIAGAQVLSFAGAEYTADDAGFELTAPDGSQLQATISQRALPRTGPPGKTTTSGKENAQWIPASRSATRCTDPTSYPAAIARLCDGGLVNVTAIALHQTATRARRATTRIRHHHLSRPRGIRAATAPDGQLHGIGPHPAALFAETPDHWPASLATYASLGQATLGPRSGDRHRPRPGRRPAGTGREHTRDLPGHHQEPR